MTTAVLPGVRQTVGAAAWVGDAVGACEHRGAGASDTEIKAAAFAVTGLAGLRENGGSL